MSASRAIASTVLVGSLALAACGGDEENEASAVTTQEAEAGIRVVSPDEASATIEAASDDLVILDVRTQEEFDEGHIDDAVLIDFYRDDFADELAQLDPDVPYVLYCRSGNRSGQARALMDDLGFTDVQDVAGGIVAWQAAGLPTVR